jgi:hypothetical protein
MADNPFIETTPLNRAAVAQAEPEVMGGANWFWWIAGLSLVNTIVLHSGGEINFVIGLGFTLIADTLFKNYLIIALGVDAVAIAIIFGLGWFSRKGYLWAFITGSVLYALDALIYLAAQDWMSVGFHCFALFYIIRGAIALRAALKAAAEPAPVA